MEGLRYSTIVSAVRRIAPETVIMIDNTRRLRSVQSPEFDIDISIRAAIGYLIGHSDAMVGTAVAMRAAGNNCGKRLSDGAKCSTPTRAYGDQPRFAHARRPTAPASRKQPQNRRMAGEPSSGRAR